MLLDLGLPDMDGQEALARLRAFSDVPVIVLSARDRETDKIAALDNGADDYVEKPFGVGELLARIRTALRHRRAQDAVPEIVRSPRSATSISRRRQARGADGAPLALSRREWVCCRCWRAMRAACSPTASCSPPSGARRMPSDVQYLRVYIGQLRQKLGSAGALIATEPGVGYRLRETDAS